MFGFCLSEEEAQSSYLSAGYNQTVIGCIFIFPTDSNCTDHQPEGKLYFRALYQLLFLIPPPSHLQTLKYKDPG